MEQEQRKLTGRQASRYDRSGGKYMSEAGTALLEDIDPHLLEEWMPQYKDAATQEERSAIWAAIKLGARPRRGNNEEKREHVREMAKEQIDQRFKEITDEEKKRDKKDLEKNMERFVESMKDPKINKKLNGESHPKDGKFGGHTKEVLREKKSLAEIGWGKAATEEVKTKLRNKFSGQHALEDEQITNAIELLIASGKTAATAAAEIENTPLNFEPSPEEIRDAYGSRETAIARKKLAFFAILNVTEKNVQRYVLQEEFAEKNEQEYQHTDPSNIEEIAWQVMHHYGHKTWGPNGTFPILEMRLGYLRDDKGNLVKDSQTGLAKVDPEKSQYYVNQSNFVRWARERMWNIYDINNDVGDFVTAINLPKTYGAMDFGRMFPEYQKYFASEDKETTYWLMAQELIIESSGLGAMNQMSVQYNKEMKDPEALQKVIGEMFATNVFTKETFRSNMLQLLTMMPLNYEGHKTGELMDNDGIFGSAMMDMFLAYYNLSDFDELEKVIGKGSSFFTREGYTQALQTVIEDKVGESTFSSQPTVMSAESIGFFEKAYDKDGLVTTEENKENFIKLINFFGNKLNTEDAEYATRRLLYKMVTEKYGKALKKIATDENGEEIKDASGEKVWIDDEEVLFLTDPVTGKPMETKIKKYGLTSDVEGKKNDTWTLRMSWVAAKAMARVFGAGARNDTTAQGYDGMTKMHYAEVYRDKMLNKNGDEAGNPYTIHQFKTFAMDPFNAIVTESFDYVRDENGKVKIDQKTGKPIQRVKPVMEVLRDIQENMAAYTSKLKIKEQEYLDTPEGPEKEAKKAELDRFRKEKNENYLNKAGQLTFKARAMSNYYDDHLMRAHEIWKVTMAAGEVSMDKYVRYDALGGVHFNRAEFQKDVQHTLIHPIRYFLNTYPDIKYNQTFRMLDQAQTIRLHKPVYRDMTLGEAMFGHELLNREAFWKKDERGKAINLRDNKGRKMKGIYEIDYDKVEDNKILVWKQWFATKIAADLWSHRAFHSTDTRFDLNYYQNVIGAIESIPGGFSDDDQAHGKPGLIGDEFSIRDQHISRRFFDKKDIAWLRKTAKSENFDLYFRAVFKDILLDDDKDEGIGLLSALSLFTRQIIKQGG